jgi:hypothetical protein
MRKRFVTIILVLVFVGIVVGALKLRKLSFIGSGYVAQQTCACMFISNRPLDSCRHDLDPLAQKIVTIEPGQNQVHAHAILSSATAHFEPTFGCSLGD